MPTFFLVPLRTGEFPMKPPTGVNLHRFLSGGSWYHLRGTWSHWKENTLEAHNIARRQHGVPDLAWSHLVFSHGWKPIGRARLCHFTEDGCFEFKKWWKHNELDGEVNGTTVPGHTPPLAVAPQCGGRRTVLTSFLISIRLLPIML